jgi:hypothetical protein
VKKNSSNLVVRWHPIHLGEGKLHLPLNMVIYCSEAMRDDKEEGGIFDEADSKLKDTLQLFSQLFCSFFGSNSKKKSWIFLQN